ncbi:hypothetical protein ACHAWO_007038 [Cyclotella atomus]|uniref:BRCT domain-containing protein n=1 Tax=Cyclotella atomus TaxID=382360 RepID=A0ABD3MKC2_9STRA
MNVASTANRRRHSLPIPQRRKRSRSSISRQSASEPLSGVVACLSGQTAADKTHLESLIVTLGGVAVRDFDPAFVTHLILDEAKGSKYEYVKRNKEKEFAKRLQVVRSEWVVDCDKEQTKVDESLYILDESAEQETPTGNAALPIELQNASLEEACEWMLSQTFSRLFTSQSFLFVGFDISEKSLDSSSDENKNMQVMIKLSKLIRRAGGTIYWSPNDVISVVVLSDGCSEEQWEDARSFCQHHPRGPMAVTPEWILSTLHSQTIKTPPFPPVPIQAIQQPAEVKPSNTVAEVTTKKALLNSNVFTGDIFDIVRSKPHDGTVSFETTEMEALIKSNGGLLLSKQLFEAIKIDIQSALKNNSTISRDFYVLSSAGYGDYSKLNPLLAELSKQSVKIVSVTPIWVKACIGDEVKYNAEEYPLLFQPQPWPIRLMPPNNFLISLTGFVDASRYGIIWMLKEIGAEYTDNLKSKNTHLICKESSGKKYEKACEWGLHVVSVDWLYHVVRYGYREGCETKFSLVNSQELPNDTADKRVDPDLPTVQISTEVVQEDKRDDVKSINGPTNPPHTVNELHGLPKNEEDVFGNEDAARKHMLFNDVTDHLLEPSKLSTSNSLDEQKEVTSSAAAAKDSTSPNDVNKRLHSALQSLETSNSNKGFPRRSKRQRQPTKTPEKSPLLLTQHSPEEDYPQTEQFTVAVRADAGLSSCSHDSVPQSQVEDAVDNGESQVVWFAEKRGA